MNPMSRIGDMDTRGGRIIRGAATVFLNNRPAGLHVSPLTPHPGGKNSVTTNGSPTVFIEGCPVLRVTSGTSCGHVIIEGSTDVFVA